MSMMVEVDVQTISIAIASASVTLAAFYYIWQIRHQSKSRRTDTFWRILSSFNSPEYLDAIMKVYSLDFKDYDDFTRKYGDFLSGKCTVGVPISMVGNLFQGAGFLVRNKLMDYDTVNQFPVVATWDKMKIIVEGVRRQGYRIMERIRISLQ